MNYVHHDVHYIPKSYLMFSTDTDYRTVASFVIQQRNPGLVLIN